MESLKLGVDYVNQLNSSHKILKFLEFVNTHLVNLKFLSFEITEDEFSLEYNKDNVSFNISADAFRSFVNHENKLYAYNDALAIKVNYYSYVTVVSCSMTAVDDYIGLLKDVLRDFKYFFSMDSDSMYHCFKKIVNITKNFELNVVVQLEYEYSQDRGVFGDDENDFEEDEDDNEDIDDNEDVDD